MRTINDFEYRGKKAEIGGLYFDEKDRMFIFVTYCEGCRGKVIFTRAEAHLFAKRYIQAQNKLRTRVMKKLARSI